jgi:hypothetical protein
MSSSFKDRFAQGALRSREEATAFDPKFVEDEHSSSETLLKQINPQTSRRRGTPFLWPSIY